MKRAPTPSVSQRNTSSNLKKIHFEEVESSLKTKPSLCEDFNDPFK